MFLPPLLTTHIRSIHKLNKYGQMRSDNGDLLLGRWVFYIICSQIFVSLTRYHIDHIKFNLI